MSKLIKCSLSPSLSGAAKMSTTFAERDNSINVLLLLLDLYSTLERWNMPLFQHMCPHTHVHTHRDALRQFPKLIANFHENYTIVLTFLKTENIATNQPTNQPDTQTANRCHWQNVLHSLSTTDILKYCTSRHAGLYETQLNSSLSL